jgi:nucleoside-diphosphate-sugar epimerase
MPGLNGRTSRQDHSRLSPTTFRVASIGGTAARRDLGYEPEWTLARGLTDDAAWLKTHEV